MEFLGEFFYGAWYWYTLILKIKLKTFGWNSIQKMCFFAFFKQWMHNNIFLSGKNHYHIKEEELLYMGIALFFSISFVW